MGWNNCNYHTLGESEQYSLPIAIALSFRSDFSQVSGEYERDGKPPSLSIALALSLRQCSLAIVSE